MISVSDFNHIGSKHEAMITGKLTSINNDYNSDEQDVYPEGGSGSDQPGT